MCLLDSSFFFEKGEINDLSEIRQLSLQYYTLCINDIEIVQRFSVNHRRVQYPHRLKEKCEKNYSTLIFVPIFYNDRGSYVEIKQIVITRQATRVNKFDTSSYLLVFTVPLNLQPVWREIS